jgi:hypothetical protein
MFAHRISSVRAAGYRSRTFLPRTCPALLTQRHLFQYFTAHQGTVFDIRQQRTINHFGTPFAPDRSSKSDYIDFPQPPRGQAEVNAHNTLAQPRRDFSATLIGCCELSRDSRRDAAIAGRFCAQPIPTRIFSNVHSLGTLRGARISSLG